MDCVKLSLGTINAGDLITELLEPSVGGTACFIGSTRSSCGGKEVCHLEYEAYETMALTQLKSLCGEMREKWPLNGIILIHRVGVVAPAEISVLVAASAVHRAAALQAVSFGIDAIKTTVPIWKKELYRDGSYCWKKN